MVESYCLYLNVYNNPLIFFFFFFKCPGPPRFLPFSPPRPFPVLSPPSPCTSLPARQSLPSASFAHSCLPALSCPLSPFLPPCPRIYPPPSPHRAAAPTQNSRTR